MTDEATFIDTIRQALGKPAGSRPEPPADLFGTPPEDREERLNHIHQRSPSDRLKLLDTFLLMSEPINTRVITVKDADAAGRAVADLAAATDPEWGTAKSVAAWDHPLVASLSLEDRLAETGIDWFAADADTAADPAARAQFRDQVIQSYLGITSADFCVADTGTLVMRTRPGQPRSVSLVPSVHVAVITLEQMVATLSELYFRLKWDPGEAGLTNAMTFISGPSKTADIELHMVHGAHGPREVHVVVITG